jgi:hypothetical protein
LEVRRAQGAEQYLTLIVPEAVGTADHGTEHLMQPGERHPRLRLHAGGSQHQHPLILCIPAHPRE